MIYEKCREPKHTNEYVQIYSSTSVNKEFFDLLMPHFANFTPGMYFGYVYTIHEFLSGTYLDDVLGDDGFKAAEKCLEHVANASLMPIAISSKDENSWTEFTPS